MHTVEHKSCDVFRAELLGQILRPLLRGQTPILIGIQFAIAVHILEYLAVNMEKLHAGFGAVRQFCTILLHQRIAICRSLFRNGCRLYLCAQ